MSLLTQNLPDYFFFFFSTFVVMVDADIYNHERDSGELHFAYESLAAHHRLDICFVLVAMAPGMGNLLIFCFRRRDVTVLLFTC